MSVCVCVCERVQQREEGIWLVSHDKRDDDKVVHQQIPKESLDDGFILHIIIS